MVAPTSMAPTVAVMVPENLIVVVKDSVRELLDIWWWYRKAWMWCGNSLVSKYSLISFGAWLGKERENCSDGSAC
jgi:hypothetical protein